MKIIEKVKEIILEDGDVLFVSNIGSNIKTEIKCSNNAITIDNLPLKRMNEIEEEEKQIDILRTLVDGKNEEK